MLLRPTICVAIWILLRQKGEIMNNAGAGFAIGIAIGTAIGIAIGNVGMGLALGVALGFAFGAAAKKKDKTS